MSGSFTAGAWHARSRTGWVALAATAIAALILGATLGRMSAPGPASEAATVVTQEIVPLSVDADGLWTAGSGDLPPIGEQLAALRREPSPSTAASIQAAGPGWRDAHDAVLRRMVGVEVDPRVRPVQREFVHGVTLSRDALDLLVAAAEAGDDPTLQRYLSSEAIRLRTRSEQVTQMARASLADVTGRGTSGVAEPPALPTFEDLR